MAELRDLLYSSLRSDKHVVTRSCQDILKFSGVEELNAGVYERNIYIMLRHLFQVPRAKQYECDFDLFSGIYNQVMTSQNCKCVHVCIFLLLWPRKI